MVFFELAVYQVGFFGGQHHAPIAGFAHQHHGLDAAGVQHLGQLDPDEAAAHHHAPADAVRVAGHGFQVGQVVEALHAGQVLAGPAEAPAFGAGGQQ